MLSGRRPLPLSLVIFIVENRLDVTKMRFANRASTSVIRPLMERHGQETDFLDLRTDNARTSLVSPMTVWMKLEPSDDVFGKDIDHDDHPLWLSCRTVMMHLF